MCNVILSIMILLVSLLHNVYADQNFIAMATELNGNISFNGQRLSLMAELPANSVLELKPNASLTFVLIETGDEYSVIGPATIKIKTTTIEVNGKALSGKMLLSSNQLVADDMAQAGLVMRGMKNVTDKDILSRE